MSRTPSDLVERLKQLTSAAEHAELRLQRSRALMRQAEAVLRHVRRDPTWLLSLHPVTDDREVGTFLRDRWRDAADNPSSMRQQGESGREGEGADPENRGGLRE